MYAYPFSSITVNGREIELDQIMKRSIAPQSPFEVSLFSFTEKWFGSHDIFIQNTSGSTGSPKPIKISRMQMEASAQLTQQALQLKRGEIALICLDPEYIAGKMMLVRSFVTGMKVMAVNPSSNPFSDIPNSILIDFTALVPAQLYAILKSEQAQRLSSTKNIIVGGAPLNPEASNLFSKVNSRIYATYGMTETVSHIALQAINGPDASPYFTVLPGILISRDHRGCLKVKASYLKEEIVTNDIVEIIDDNHFKWMGRSDNVINSGGVKIIPEKIEAEAQLIFTKLQIENRVLVSSVPDPTLGNKVVMLIEGNLSGRAIELIKSELRQKLHAYEIPKELYTNISFVLTKNGKINRLETTRKIEI